MHAFHFSHNFGRMKQTNITPSLPVCFHVQFGVDVMGTGVTELLLTGLLAIDYAQLIHKDPEDSGPTVVFRFTDANPEVSNAYHFVQPTLWCEGKRGVVCMQRAGTLTVFCATKFAHTSTYNEHKADPETPSVGVACVQKRRSLNVSDQRSDVLEDIISFPVLTRYHSMWPEFSEDFKNALGDFKNAIAEGGHVKG